MSALTETDDSEVDAWIKAFKGEKTPLRESVEKPGIFPAESDTQGSGKSE